MARKRRKRRRYGLRRGKTPKNYGGFGGTTTGGSKGKGKKPKGAGRPAGGGFAGHPIPKTKGHKQKTPGGKTPKQYGTSSVPAGTSGGPRQPRATPAPRGSTLSKTRPSVDKVFGKLAVGDEPTPREKAKVEQEQRRQALQEVLETRRKAAPKTRKAAPKQERRQPAPKQERRQVDRALKRFQQDIKAVEQASERSKRHATGETVSATTGGRGQLRTERQSVKAQARQTRRKIREIKEPSSPIDVAADYVRGTYEGYRQSARDAATRFKESESYPEAITGLTKDVGKDIGPFASFPARGLAGVKYAQPKPTPTQTARTAAQRRARKRAEGASAGKAKPTKARQQAQRRQQGQRQRQQQARQRQVAAGGQGAAGKLRTFGARSRGKAATKKKLQYKLRGPGKGIRRTPRGAGAPGLLERAEGVAELGAAGAAPITFAGGAAVQYLREPKQIPERTKNTARAVVGMPTAVLGDIEDLARGDTEGFLKSQKAYWDMYASLPDDPDEHVTIEVPRVSPYTGRTFWDTETMTASEARDELGWVPAAFGVGGAYFLGRGALGRRRVRGAEPTVRERKLQETIRQADDPKADRSTRKKAERAVAKLSAKGIGFPGRHRQRKLVSEIVQESKIAGRKGLERDVKTITKDAPPGFRKRLIDDDAKLQNKKIKGTSKDLRYVDVVQFLGRENVPMDPQRGPDYIRNQIMPNKWGAEAVDEIPGPRVNEPVVRDVVEALLDNPQIFADKTLKRYIAGLKKYGYTFRTELHEERTGRPQDTPLPEYDRSRTLHEFQTGRIPTVDERIPEGYNIRTKAQSGVSAEDAVRHEAKLHTGRAMRHRADERRRRIDANTASREARSRREDGDLEGAALKQREAEQLHRDERVFKAGADAEHKMAESKLGAINKPSRAVYKEKRAKDIEEGRLNPREGETPEGLRAESSVLRSTHNREQSKLREQAQNDIMEWRNQHGMDPEGGIYFPERDVVRGGLDYDRVLANRPLTTKDRFRSGELGQRGAIPEAGREIVYSRLPQRLHALMTGGKIAKSEAQGIIASMGDQRRAMAMRDISRRFADEFFSEGLTRSTDEWLRRAEAGTMPPNHVLVDPRGFDRVFRVGNPEETDSFFTNALEREIKDAQLEPGGTATAVPTAALKELRDQMKPLNKFWSKAKHFGRLQSMALLAASPLWFFFQLGATPLAIAIRHPDLTKWPKAATDMVRLQRNARKSARGRKELDDFNSRVGGASGDIATLVDESLSTNPKGFNEFRNASSVLHATWSGKLISSLKHGGPLIRGNVRYEEAWRTFDALLEVNRLDRELDRPMMHRFAASVAELDDVTRRHITAMKGKSPKERVAFYNRNPKAMREISRRVYDATGNWTAMTRFEKHAAITAIFYPFLRFSVRWSFYSMPKNHPLRAALLLNLSQQNAHELEQFFGDDKAPQFFTQWANPVTHSGPGGVPEIARNYARLSPSSNALIEALGGDAPLSVGLTRTTQPILGAGVAQGLFGTDPFTGEQIEPGEDPSRLDLFSRQVLGLTPPTRYLRDEKLPASVPGVKEQTEVGELFEHIRGQDEGYQLPFGLGEIPAGAKRFVSPDLTQSLGRTRSQEQLSDLLGETEGGQHEDKRHALRYVGQLVEKVENGDLNPAQAKKQAMKYKREVFDPALKKQEQLDVWLAQREWEKNGRVGKFPSRASDISDETRDELFGEIIGRATGKIEVSFTKGMPEEESEALFGDIFEDLGAGGKKKDKELFPSLDSLEGGGSKRRGKTKLPSGSDKKNVEALLSAVRSGDIVVREGGSSRKTPVPENASINAIMNRGKVTDKIEKDAAPETPKRVKQQVEKRLVRAVQKSADGVPEAVPERYRAAVAKHGKLVDDAAKEVGMTGAQYLAATIDFETGGTWDPSIKNPTSSAFGLGQFIDSTAEDFRSRLGVETQDPKQPEQQIKGAAMHLSGKFDYSPLYDGYNSGYGPDPIPERAQQMGGIIGGKPIPKGLKRRAAQVLGKKKTQQIVKSGGIAGLQPQRKPATIKKIGKEVVEKFGVTLTEGPGKLSESPVPSGGHSDNSLHYQAAAYDIQGTPEQLMKTYQYIKKNYGGDIEELIYDPANEAIFDGVVQEGAYGDHPTHVHVAETQRARMGVAGGVTGGGAVSSAGGGGISVSSAPGSSTAAGATRGVTDDTGRQQFGSRGLSWLSADPQTYEDAEQRSLLPGTAVDRVRGGMDVSSRGIDFPEDAGEATVEELRRALARR